MVLACDIGKLLSINVGRSEGAYEDEEEALCRVAVSWPVMACANSWLKLGTGGRDSWAGNRYQGPTAIPTLPYHTASLHPPLAPSTAGQQRMCNEKRFCCNSYEVHVMLNHRDQLRFIQHLYDYGMMPSEQLTIRKATAVNDVLTKSYSNLNESPNFSGHHSDLPAHSKLQLQQSSAGRQTWGCRCLRYQTLQTSRERRRTAEHGVVNGVKRTIVTGPQTVILTMSSCSAPVSPVSAMPCR